MSSRALPQVPPMSEQIAPNAEQLRLSLGVNCDTALLELALVHRSYAYENGGIPTNERLEFLGDSVLGIVVTDKLYRDFPDLPEGQLARMRASVVNAQALADVARALDLGPYIRLGKGELASGGSTKTSILADCLEAVIGAVYLSEGMASVEPWIISIFGPLISEASQLGAGLDWKTSLQEITGQLGVDLPEYRLSDTGPDHAKHFSADVYVSGELLGQGQGSSKKIAEQVAAQEAYQKLAEKIEFQSDARIT